MGGTFIGLVKKIFVNLGQGLTAFPEIGGNFVGTPHLEDGNRDRRLEVDEWGIP